MTRLTDTQTVILSGAALRDGGSVYPLPDSIKTCGARLTRALGILVDRGLLIERDTTVAAEAHRTDGDLRYGLYITDTGLTAIGIDGDDGREADVPAPAPVERVTKASMVLSLLQRDDGATLGELIEATGWLPHTTRAALTGLRKKGHAVERGKRGDVTCYSVAVTA